MNVDQVFLQASTCKEGAGKLITTPGGASCWEPCASGADAVFGVGRYIIIWRTVFSLHVIISSCFGEHQRLVSRRD